MFFTKKTTDKKKVYMHNIKHKNAQVVCDDKTMQLSWANNCIKETHNVTFYRMLVRQLLFVLRHLTIKIKIFQGINAGLLLPLWKNIDLKSTNTQMKFRLWRVKNDITYCTTSQCCFYKQIVSNIRQYKLNK